VDAFARVDTPEAWYDLANAYAKRGELKLAVQAYDKALALRPAWPDAEANRERVAALIPKEKKPDDEQGEADPSQEPDEVKFDDKGKKGKRGQVELEELTDQQIAQMWLRGVQTSPAEFLRLKFAVQAQEANSRKPEAAGRSAPSAPGAAR
jgi:Ca-activated chloride channel family protein